MEWKAVAAERPCETLALLLLEMAGRGGGAAGVSSSRLGGCEFGPSSRGEIPALRCHLANDRKF